jgi:predicted XRE-type DNA-binding protein
MSPRLQFRNVEASSDDPVETWPVEAMQIALERGGLSDWRPIVRAIQKDPWGPVSRNVEYVLTYSRPYGVAEFMQRSIERQRQRAELADRAEVARRLREAVATSGLGQQQFAERIGTSQPRLSTYLSGKVTPSAALLLRAERLAQG